MCYRCELDWPCDTIQLLDALVAEQLLVAALEHAVDALLRVTSKVREGEWCGICGARDVRTYSGLCLTCQVYTMQPADEAAAPPTGRTT